MISSAEIAKYVAVLRDRAGLKQVELAKRVTWSAAHLSRIEAGERALSEEELDSLLNAIGTPEAIKLRVLMQRHWEMLPQPPLNHADQDLFWSAENVAKELRDLGNRDDVKSVFEKRIAEYITELSQTSALLLADEYQVAFIGSIGVGKSTAICKMTGLEVPGADAQPPIPVLEAGGGGVTICEVHLRHGPEYGLIVEPRSEDEIRRDVSDFAEFFLSPQLGDVSDERDGSDGDSPGLSKEIARAVRNMSGLRVRREKGLDGKTIRHDEAKELASQFTEPRALAVEILSRMQLHRRDRRDIWYSNTAGKSALQWLKETFALINNGRHPEFSLPKRIEVVVMDEILGMDSVSVRLIDTKGIDQTAERADLECHFDVPHTVTVLCTGFNSAPAPEVQLLLKRAKETGVRNLPLKSAVLALPRPSEALAVKDDTDGTTAKSTEDGYELKREQAEMQLHRLGLEGLQVGFFNSREDAPSSLRDLLAARILALQESYRARLAEVVANAKTLLQNYEKEQVQEVLHEAAHRLAVWLKNNEQLGRTNLTVHDSLFEALGRAYASTIRATVNRAGAWSNLDYAHHLGHGARRIASAAADKNFESFKAVATNLLQEPELVDAQDLVRQALRVMESSIEELTRKVQLLGQAIYLDELKADREFWNGCLTEWGRDKIDGKGYRDRVSSRNREWFDANARVHYEDLVRELLDKEWKQVVNRLAGLFPVELTITA